MPFVLPWQIQRRNVSFCQEQELSAHLMRSILARNPKLNPGEIADIIWGCVQQTLEQCYNIGETLSSSPIFLNMFRLQTINRLCGSSMTALHMATQEFGAKR